MSLVYRLLLQTLVFVNQRPRTWSATTETRYLGALSLNFLQARAAWKLVRTTHLVLQIMTLQTRKATKPDGILRDVIIQKLRMQRLIAPRRFDLSLRMICSLNTQLQTKRADGRGRRQ